MKSILKMFLNPIKNEFPFLICVYFLLIPRTLFFFICNPQRWFDNFEQFPTLRFLALSLLYSYFLTILAYKIKWIKFFAYIVLYLLFFANIYLAINFNAAISPNSLLLLFETTTAEIQDFLYTYAFSVRSYIAYASLLLIISLNIYFESKREQISVWITTKLSSIYKKSLIILFFLFFLGGVYELRLFPQLFSCKLIEDVDKWNPVGKASMDIITNFIMSLYDLHLMGEVLSKAIEATNQINKGQSSYNWGDDSCNVILVIGESFIKNHSSLYGYYLKTNPRLEKEKDSGRLFVFTNVITSIANTSTSVRNMLSCNSIGNGEKWYEYPYFPAIFKQTGYKVYFWDNQFKPTSNASYDFSLNAYIHGNKIVELSYDAEQGQVSMLDEELVDHFVEHCKTNPLERLNFAIFHLQGQHFAPKNRYPHNGEFDLFKSSDIKRKETWLTERKKQKIAEYDNCTLYNDSVIYKILELYKCENTIVVYLSDHSETVYDVGDYTGRRLDLTSKDPQLIHQFNDIPFVVWCSDLYMKKHPDIVYALQQSTSKPMMADNLCHMLMRLGGIKSNYYNKDRDILSETYSCPPRIVYDSIYYDKLGE